MPSWKGVPEDAAKKQKRVPEGAAMSVDAYSTYAASYSSVFGLVAVLYNPLEEAAIRVHVWG